MKTKTDLLNGNITKSLLLFAFPILISNIFQQLYSTVDTMVVGHFLGDSSLAAIGACGAIYDLLVGFALGVGNGLSIVSARSYGAGNKELLKKSVASSCVIGLIISVSVSAIGVLILKPLLLLLNTPEDIINQAYSYISIITIFIIVMFCYNLLAGLLKSIGNSFMSVVFLVIASIINIFLDILFIANFNMGIKGAAIATVISQGVSAALCFIYIFKKCPELIPSKEHFKVDKELYKEMLGQGFSMGMMSSLVSAGSVILQSSINDFGMLTIAGHTAARRAFSFCIMPMFTLAMALSTFVSQNRGANNGYRIRKSVKVTIVLSCIWGVFITIVLFFSAPLIIKTISGSNDNTVLTNGAKYLQISSPFFGILGVLSAMRFALQGLGKKITPLISSVIELLGKILFVILVIPFMGYLGVILCEPIIWCIMCVQLCYTFYNDPYIIQAKYA